MIGLLGDIFAHAENQRLKNEGMELAANSNGAEDWLTKARSIAKTISALTGECTSDDVLKQCPRPATVSPNATGSIFKGKGWRCVGHIQTSKISGHGRTIKRWVFE